MVIKSVRGVAACSALGAVAGFLMRPCCLGPAALSVIGVSSVGLSDVFAAYRTLLIGTGALMLGTTMWINVRRDGGWVNKIAAVAAAVVGFGWSLRIMGAS